MPNLHITRVENHYEVTGDFLPAVPLKIYPRHRPLYLSETERSQLEKYSYASTNSRIYVDGTLFADYRRGIFEALSKRPEVRLLLKHRQHATDEVILPILARITNDGVEKMTISYLLSDAFTLTLDDIPGSQALVLSVLFHNPCYKDIHARYPLLWD